MANRTFHVTQAVGGDGNDLMIQRHFEWKLNASEESKYKRQVFTLHPVAFDGVISLASRKQRIIWIQ